MRAISVSFFLEELQKAVHDAHPQLRSFIDLDFGRGNQETTAR